jgi:hypothetical protein
VTAKELVRCSKLPPLFPTHPSPLFLTLLYLNIKVKSKKRLDSLLKRKPKRTKSKAKNLRKGKKNLLPRKKRRKKSSLLKNVS